MLLSEEVGRLLEAWYGAHVCFDSDGRPGTIVGGWADADPIARCRGDADAVYGETAATRVRRNGRRARTHSYDELEGERRRTPAR